MGNIKFTDIRETVSLALKAEYLVLKIQYSS